MPGGVIGNTAEFGSAFPGSSPGGAVLRLDHYVVSLSTSQIILAERAQGRVEGWFEMWYVYSLECENQSLYTGVTNDLNRRVETHKIAKGGHYTKSFGVNKLIYHEAHQTKF